MRCLNSLWSRPLSVLFGSLILATVGFAQVSIGISVGFPPPELPVYEQPVCPADGYIWTPGYWAWDGDDYYWVPGTWVLAPEVGFFWTPPYWGWEGSAYIFHEGYWGPEVGFYGGIDYGFGYFGHGYEGGRWDHGHFYYNREVNHVNVTVIHNVYTQRITNRTETHVSYNGGRGGISARPTSQEEAADRGRHIPTVAAQTQHIQEARSNPQLRASANHGKPPIAATAKPADFREGAVPAQSAARYNPPARMANNHAQPAVHPNDLAPHEKPAPAHTGNAQADQKYQQQQEKLYQRQEQEHQNLQQQQEKEHQQMAKQQANEAQKQQMEARHQQQTQQMEQRHAQEQQHTVQQHEQQQHQAPPPHETQPRKP